MTKRKLKFSQWIAKHLRHDHERQETKMVAQEFDAEGHAMPHGIVAITIFCRWCNESYVIDQVDLET